MNALNKGLTKSAKALEIVMIAALMVMVLVMFMQVVLRYAFATGFAWTEELSRFLMVYMIFVGGAVLAAQDGHISVTILDELLKGVPQKILKLVQYLLCLLYSGIMAKIGYSTLAIVGRQKSPNMQITMDWIYAIVPVSMALIVLYLLIKIALLFTHAPQKEGEAQ